MPFIRNVPGLETIHRDYSSKGVQFYFLYKGLRHPGTNGMVEAVTLQERLKQITHANKQLQTTIPWICDGLDGALEKTLGGAPNSEFVIDENGVILRKRFWHDPADLRKYLAKRFGAIEKPTTVKDLEAERQPITPPQIKPGLVAPLTVPNDMKLCEVASLRPKENTQPLYVKMLVEADQALLKEGKGSLWLGFFLDPIYGTHWDNKVGQLHWELSCDDPEFQTITGITPTYDHPADIDPRELLLDFKAAKKGAHYTMSAKFSISGEAGNSSSTLTEKYQFQLKASTRSARRAGDWMIRIIGNPMSFDLNKDGQVTQSELPAKRAEIYLLHYDQDHDSAISSEEAKTFHKMIRYSPKE